MTYLFLKMAKSEKYWQWNARRKVWSHEISSDECKLSTYFQPMYHLCTLWKQKTGALLLLAGIEVEHWLKMGWINKFGHRIYFFKFYRTSDFRTVFLKLLWQLKCIYHQVTFNTLSLSDLCSKSLCILLQLF